MSDYWKNSSEKRRSHEAVQRLGMHNQSASIRSHLMSEISPQSSLSGKGVTAFPNARQKQKARIMGSLRDQDDGPGGLERFTAVFIHMELMMEAGLSPMQIITAATRSSAEFLHAADLGTIQATK